LADARESNENTPKIRFLRWRLWAIVSVRRHARSPATTHPIDRSATKTSSPYLDIIEAPVSGISCNIPVMHGHGMRDERSRRGVPIVNGTGALRARAGCGPLKWPAGNPTTGLRRCVPSPDPRSRVTHGSLRGTTEREPLEKMAVGFKVMDTDAADYRYQGGGRHALNVFLGNGSSEISGEASLDW